MIWQTYATFSPSVILPLCPNCFCREVTLVDMTINIVGVEVTTQPVWYCNFCQIIFSKRTEEMKGLLDNHKYQVNPYLNLDVDNMYVSENSYFTDTMVRYMRSKTSLSHIEATYPELSNEVSSLKEKVNSLWDKLKNPLEFLRTEINNFKLR